MQAQLGKGGTEGLKRRIKNHNVKLINTEWMDEANDLLKDVNLEEVKKISDGSAYFYSWVWKQSYLLIFTVYFSVKLRWQQRQHKNVLPHMWLFSDCNHILT